MLTILDFAALSLFSYKNMTEIRRTIPHVVSLHKFTSQKFLDNVNIFTNSFYEVILDKRLQDNTDQGFYASLFVKIVGHEAMGAVMAIRGTYNLANDWQDIKTWGEHVVGLEKRLNNMSDYTQPALSFLRTVNEYCLNELKLPQDKIFITGHSLGGAVASILRAKMSVPNRVITFNAPGIRDLPGVNPNRSEIINIRSHYDLVSALDYPVGPYWNINVPELQAQAKKAFLTYAKEQHNPQQTKIERLKTFIEDLDVSMLPGGLETVVADDISKGKDDSDWILAQHSIDNLYKALRSNHYIRMSHNSFNTLYFNAKKTNFDYADI